MEFSHVTANGKSVRCELKFERRKTLSMSFRGPVLVVKSPPGVPSTPIRRFLEDREGWIEERLDRIGSAATLASADSAALTEGLLSEEGAFLPLFGEDRRCRWELRSGPAQIRIEGSSCVLLCPQKTDLRLPLIQALRGLCEVSVEKVASSCVERLGYSGPWTVNSALLRGKWGCCLHGPGRMDFDWRCVFLPPHLFGYLVAHECAHLLVPNHGPKFWRSVCFLRPAGRVEDEELNSWLHRMPLVE